MPTQLSAQVLIVDGRREVRAQIAECLRQDGARRYRLHEASTAAAALDVVAEENLDLIVAAWELPDGSCLDLLVGAVSSELAPALIVVTDSIEASVGGYVVAHGAADSLSTGELTIPTLARACAQALARRALEQEIDAVRRDDKAALAAAQGALYKLERAHRRASSLESLVHDLECATTTKAVAAVVVDHIGLFDRVNALSVYAIESDALRLIDSVGLGARTVAKFHSVPLSTPTSLTEAVLRNEVLFSPQEPELQTHSQKKGAIPGGWLAVPLRSGDAPVGLLCLRYRVSASRPANGIPHHLADAANVERWAHHIAQALNRARANEGAQRKAEFDAWLLNAFARTLDRYASALQGFVRNGEASGAGASLVADLRRQMHGLEDVLSHAMDRGVMMTSGERTAALPTHVPLDVVVQQQLERFRRAYPTRAIESVIADDVTGVDPASAAKLVSNLLRNALEHGGADSPVGVVVQGDRQLSVLEVRSARPVAGDELAMIREALECGPRAIAEGIGFGLVIVRECADILAGQLTVSVAAHGTTFRLVVRDLRRSWQTLARAPGPDHRS